MLEESDANLVEECLSGRQEAFETLVERYQDSVYSMNLNLTRYNRVEAADLTQEAFVRAYQKLHLYKEKYPFKNWLLRLASNVSKNRFRKNARRYEVELEYTEERKRTTDLGEDPRRAQLIEAMCRLPDALRMAVSLRHTEGLSYDEMSEVLGIGVSAAKMRVSRGTQMLSQWLGESSEEGRNEQT